MNCPPRSHAVEPSPGRLQCSVHRWPFGCAIRARPRDGTCAPTSGCYFAQEPATLMEPRSGGWWNRWGASGSQGGLSGRQVPLEPPRSLETVRWLGLCHPIPHRNKNSVLRIAFHKSARSWERAIEEFLCQIRVSPGTSQAKNVE